MIQTCNVSLEKNSKRILSLEKKIQNIFCLRKKYFKRILTLGKDSNHILCLEQIFQTYFDFEQKRAKAQTYVTIEIRLN